MATTDKNPIEDFAMNTTSRIRVPLLRRALDNLEICQDIRLGISPSYRGKKYTLDSVAMISGRFSQSQLTYCFSQRIQCDICKDG